MKIDIQDVKFWMDAIRNSEDRDRTLESFWDGQLKSKSWLIENLEKNSRIANANVVIHGGWNGVLASMLFNSNIGIKKIISIDIDPSCEKIARTINKRQEIEGKFIAVTADMSEYEYNEIPDIVINTSCEHLFQPTYNKWFKNIPKSAKIVLQSNNYYELDEHVNCSNSLEEFINKSKLTDIMIKDQLELPKYKRFMIIGGK